MKRTEYVSLTKKKPKKKINQEEFKIFYTKLD